MKEINIIKDIKKIINSFNNNNDNWMTLKEACEFSRLSRATLFRAISQGRLKTSKNTGKLLFKKKWLNSFLGD